MSHVLPTYDVIGSFNEDLACVTCLNIPTSKFEKKWIRMDSTARGAEAQLDSHIDR